MTILVAFLSEVWNGHWLQRIIMESEEEKPIILLNRQIQNLKAALLYWTCKVVSNRQNDDFRGTLSDIIALKVIWIMIERKNGSSDGTVNSRGNR